MKNRTSGTGRLNNHLRLAKREQSDENVIPRIVVVGGGLAGCAAAVAGVKAGAAVTLLERMELLGGCGLVAGNVDDTCFPIREELRLMGGDDIFRVIDNCMIHKNVKWPKPGANKTLYDVIKLDCELKKDIEDAGVKILLQSRASDVKMDGKRIRSVTLDGGIEIHGDAFVDATGTAGPVNNCKKYGNGCVLCLLRCPTFGGRISIAAKAGVKEQMGKKPDGSIGQMSDGYNLLKESLAPELRKEMESIGCAAVPVPRELLRRHGQNPAANMTEEKFILVDNGGYAKLIADGFRPLHEIRKLPGLERARHCDPYAGTVGHSMRFFAISPRDDALSVPGVDNLFIAGEKFAGNCVTIAIMTGVVAGYNAVRKAANMAPLILPRTTMLGDFIAYVNERWDTEEGLKARIGPVAEPYLHRAKETGLYTEDKNLVQARIEKNKLVNVLSQKINL